MIVEDSAVVCELLTHIIGHDPRLEVAVVFRDAEKAIAQLPHLKPDVISMDIRLPGMNGLEATRQIMRSHPTPIVVVSGCLNDEDLNIALNALKAGALSVIEKPVGTTHADYVNLAERLCTQLAIMSQVKVIRQKNVSQPDAVPTLSISPNLPFAALGVAASTGGPQALIELFNGLGPQFPLPVLLVQHILPAFTDGFARWLAKTVPFDVCQVNTITPLKPGTIYVPPADRHLVVSSRYASISADPLVAAQRPSGTVLFRTMAKQLGARGMGVVLTGMGNDGAEGLLALKQAGGYTLAEDASTAVVYGMPAAAIACQAICKQMPLPALSKHIHQILAKATQSITNLTQ